jgi:hypothetical protein
MSRHSEWRTALVIVTSIVAVQRAFIGRLRIVPPEQTKSGDQREYHRYGVRIAAGEDYFTFGFRPPVYLYVLGTFLALGGIGLWVNRHKGALVGFSVLILLITTVALATLVYGHPRYHKPLMPVFILFVWPGFQQLQAWLRRHPVAAPEQARPCGRGDLTR